MTLVGRSECWARASLSGSSDGNLGLAEENHASMPYVVSPDAGSLEMVSSTGCSTFRLFSVGYTAAVRVSPGALPSPHTAYTTYTVLS